MLTAVQPPLPGLSPQADSFSGAQRSGGEIARRILESHRNALQRRRPIELTWEKGMLWLDGEGDNQWADIFDGQRVAIPRLLNEYRVSHNLLRPIVDNAVAYHTTKSLRFVVEARKDNQAQQQAVIDAAVVNYICRDQHVNGHLSQAMYLAMVAGFCPVHAAWRDDALYAPYEPLYLQPEETQGLQMPRKGLVHVWVGNPFDTTYNASDKRGSISAIRYGRVVSAERVRETFGVQIEGTDRLPSASVFQRVAHKWQNMWGLNRHGSATMQSGHGGEELLALVCEEVPPGIEAEYPAGRLTVIALPGAAETHREGGSGGRAVHLATQPLPAARFSSVPFYSSQRMDDVYGAPWVGPLMPLQGDLNDLLSDQKQYRKRMVNAPTMVNGDVRDDELRYDGYAILTVDGESKFTPKVMELPGGPLTAISNEIERVQQSMFTIGGYQAASRGEGQAGDPASKTMFLAQKDDTIHGPINQEFRFACEEFAKLIHANFATYADVDWLVESVGDDFEVLGETYINKSHVSQRPPQFRVVSGFGATTDLEAQNLISMVTTPSVEGPPLLSLADFQRKYPDQSLYDNRNDPHAAQVQRARLGNSVIRKVVAEWKQKNGVPDGPGYYVNDPVVQQAALWIAQDLDRVFPALPTDDPAAHMAARMELNQDEKEDPFVRAVGLINYQQYQQWQAQLAQYAAMQQGGQQALAQGPALQQEQEAKGMAAQQEAAASQQGE